MKHHKVTTIDTIDLYILATWLLPTTFAATMSSLTVLSMVLTAPLSITAITGVTVAMLTMLMSALGSLTVVL